MTHSVIKLSGSVNESFRNRNNASVGDELCRRCEGNDTGGGLGGTLWMFTATGLAALLVHFALAFGPPKGFFVSLFPSLSSSTASLAIFGFSQSTPTFPLSAFLPPAGILMFCDSEQGYRRQIQRALIIYYHRTYDIRQCFDQAWRQWTPAKESIKRLSNNI